MIKRIALLVGSVAAAGVLAIGLAAAGFGPVATNADQADAQAFAEMDAATADTAATEPLVQVQTETVYVRPPVAPKVIHVTKKVPAAKAAAVSTKTTKRASHDDDEHEHENEHEGEDD